jgi:hypothetical protein
VIRLGFGVSRGHQLTLKKPVSATEHISERRSLSSPRDPRLLERLQTFRRAVTMMFTDLKESTEYFENFGDIAGLAWFMNVTMRCGRRLKSVEVAL